MRTKSIEEIEGRMAGVDENSVRHQVLKSARDFKSSWVNLGQALYSVWKDKLYRDWGYLKFDSYTAKEIGIRKQTALKLLRSYYFLEKEEPHYLDKNNPASENVAAIPNYESIDLLRLAKKKNTLDATDYHRLKKDVLDMGRDAREVKKDLTALIRQREELEPEEARSRRRLSAIKRLVTNLKSLKLELEASKLAPSNIINQINILIGKVEAEIDR